MNKEQLDALAEKFESNQPRTCGDLDQAARVIRAMAKLEQLAATSHSGVASVDYYEGRPDHRWRMILNNSTAGTGDSALKAIEAAK